MNWFMYVKENVGKKKWFCVMSPLINMKHQSLTMFAIYPVDDSLPNIAQLIPKVIKNGLKKINKIESLFEEF
jgi:hypothetical protein